MSGRFNSSLVMNAPSSIDKVRLLDEDEKDHVKLPTPSGDPRKNEGVISTDIPLRALLIFKAIEYQYNYLTMNLTKTFDFENSKIRTSGTFEDPLFCVQDVCALLGVKYASKKITLLDADERDDRPIRDTIGRSQITAFCTEPGLYRIIFSCRNNPKTEPIKRWVFHEVLPSIRKTGEYKLKRDLAEVTKLLEDTQETLGRIQQEKNESDQNFDKVSTRHAWTRILEIRGIESGSFKKRSLRYKRMCKLVSRLKIHRAIQWVHEKPYFISEEAIQECMDVIQNWQL
jgi:prophage antirepressor-like protein